MSIIRTKQKPEVNLPPALHEQARTALRYQVARDYYDEKYGEVKTTFFGIVEKSDAITLEVGKSLRFPEGLFRWQARSNHAIDTAPILAALVAKKLTVDSLLACVSKFKTDALAALVPGAVQDAEATEYGVMQATAAYKQQIIGELERDDETLAGIRSQAAENLEEPLEASLAAQAQKPRRNGRAKKAVA